MKMRSKKIIIGGCMAMLWSAPYGYAQTTLSFDTTGSVRAAAWTSSRTVDTAGPIPISSAWLKLKGQVENNTVLAEGWLQAAGNTKTAVDTARLRELYWKTVVDDLDLRFGVQSIVWGRADALNPTDSIGRRDFTLLHFAEADQRLGSLAATAQYYFKDYYSAQFIWLPAFRSDVIPLATKPLQYITRPAVLHRDQWAVKLDHSGGAIDYSLSYFNGYDRRPDLSLTSVTLSGLYLALSNHRVQVIGADASLNVGSMVLRGEVAWSERSEPNTVEGFFRKRSQLTFVVGGDKNIGWDTNVNLQLIGQWIPHYRRVQSTDQLTDPIAQAVAVTQAAINNQDEKNQIGVTYRIGKSWLNETWQAELAGVYSLTTHGRQVRAQVLHSLDDQWRLQLGLERFLGDTTTVFGQLRHNSAGYVELRYVF